MEPPVVGRVMNMAGEFREVLLTATQAGVVHSIADLKAALVTAGLSDAPGFVVKLLFVDNSQDDGERLPGDGEAIFTEDGSDCPLWGAFVRPTETIHLRFVEPFIRNVMQEMFPGLTEAVTDEDWASVDSSGSGGVLRLWNPAIEKILQTISKDTTERTGLRFLPTTEVEVVSWMLKDIINGFSSEGLNYINPETGRTVIHDAVRFLEVAGGSRPRLHDDEIEEIVAHLFDRHAHDLSPDLAELCTTRATICINDFDARLLGMADTATSVPLVFQLLPIKEDGRGGYTTCFPRKRGDSRTGSGDSRNPLAVALMKKVRGNSPILSFQNERGDTILHHVLTPVHHVMFKDHSWLAICELYVAKCTARDLLLRNDSGVLAFSYLEQLCWCFRIRNDSGLVPRFPTSRKWAPGGTSRAWGGDNQLLEGWRRLLEAMKSKLLATSGTALGSEVVSVLNSLSWENYDETDLVPVLEFDELRSVLRTLEGMSLNEQSANYSVVSRPEETEDPLEVDTRIRETEEKLEEAGNNNK